jgi:hypothetical protein
MGPVGVIGPSCHVRLHQHADRFFPGGNLPVNGMAPFVIDVHIVLVIELFAHGRGAAARSRWSRRVIAIDQVIVVEVVNIRCCGRADRSRSSLSTLAAAFAPNFFGTSPASTAAAAATAGPFLALAARTPFGCGSCWTRRWTFEHIEVRIVGENVVEFVDRRQWLRDGTLARGLVVGSARGRSVTSFVAAGSVAAAFLAPHLIARTSSFALGPSATLDSPLACCTTFPRTATASSASSTATASAPFALARLAFT